MSQIAAIYSNLAGMAVTVGSTTPTVYGPAALPKTLDTVQTPCRVLDPSFGPDRAEFRFYGHGDSNADVYWTISDVLLWKAQGQDLGPLAVAGNLTSYVGAYAEAARAKRELVTGQQVELQAIVPVISFDIEWPARTGRFFYGVVMTLTILEVLSG